MRDLSHPSRVLVFSSIYLFIFHHCITHPHPCPVSTAAAAVAVWVALEDDDVVLWWASPFFFVSEWCLCGRDTSPGLTDTLIGVGCVLNTGSWQSSNVRVSGVKHPFPMQINRKRSPPLHSGMPENGNEYTSMRQRKFPNRSKALEMNPL